MLAICKYVCPMIKTFEQVLEISNRIDNKNLKFNALQHLAKGSFAKEDHRSSIQFARQALDLLNELETPMDQTEIQDVLITSLMNEEIFNEAIAEIQTGLKKAKFAQDKNRELTLLGQLADAQFLSDDLDASLHSYQLALDLSVKLQKKLLEGRLSGRLGAIHADQEEIELSNKYIDRAINLAETEKDVQNLAEQCYLRALNYRQTGQDQQAIEFCNRSIEIFSKTGFSVQTQEARNLLKLLQSN